MIIACKKTESCFADSRTYEYALTISAEEFLKLLDNTWLIRKNMKLRRPVFLAERDQIRIKGILAGSIIRVSYPEASWEIQKKIFEEWMEHLYD